MTSKFLTIFNQKVAFCSNFFRTQNKNRLSFYREAVSFLEVPARFELANESFADSCLTTWPRYHMEIRNVLTFLIFWSG